MDAIPGWRTSVLLGLASLAFYFDTRGRPETRIIMIPSEPVPVVAPVINPGRLRRLFTGCIGPRDDPGVTHDATVVFYPFSRFKVLNIMPGFWADSIGLRDGDDVLAIDGVKIESFETSMKIYLATRQPGEHRMLVQRNERPVTLRFRVSVHERCVVSASHGRSAGVTF